jgi:hypothetical protein
LPSGQAFLAGGLGTKNMPSLGSASLERWLTAFMKCLMVLILNSSSRIDCYSSSSTIDLWIESYLGSFSSSLLCASLQTGLLKSMFSLFKLE